MANAIDKAVRAQGGFVVKPHQVKAMILAARRAYVKLKSCEVEKLRSTNPSTPQPLNLSTLPSFDAWRKATLHDVVGAAEPSSFRAVTQRDYAAVMRYFLSLAGEEELKSEVEVEQRMSSSTVRLRASPSPKAADERRRALWALNLEEGRLEDHFGGRGGARKYADSLFWGIHKTDRYTATARQVWAVIFTLRSRAAKRLRSCDVAKLRSCETSQPLNRSTSQLHTRAKTALGARGTSDVPLSPPDGSKRFPAFSRAL